VTATPTADAHLERDIFPSRLRHLVEAALTGRLSEATLIVIPRTSDADYKCFLYLREFVRRGIVRKLPPVLLFDLLQSAGRHVPVYDVSRTQALTDQLAASSGRVISTDDLRAEIVRTNAARAAARRLSALRRGAARVAGAEAFPLLAAFWRLAPDDYAPLAGEAADVIARRAPLDGPRVLLLGAPVDTSRLHAAIESQGAVVVAEAGPWGSEAAGDDVAAAGDPIAALADKYRADVSGPRAPAEAVRRFTERALDDADAVVVLLPPDDMVFGWDYPSLRARLQGRGIPHACFRGDPYQPLTPEDQAQLRALVAAAERHEAPRG
jgi:benzoyl-CoA reductase/2-hydroxyglutaryl-CoA dehydratase subunit BcrC/BadD/HgdB